ncbi:uncharacterized protein LOC128845040 isoform X2 [Malaclemys terrapin pileata]|uniref:uncharacterized protein LOC128845040 isoform X2 n=1 Tax=Malaclemys terrapin pileata TaxID=2991368 RepID=UPI0023A8A3D6|nr:uncharacterized protein LOC128845040 isoform X2 [Malaclemys terrapin pileata]
MQISPCDHLHVMIDSSARSKMEKVQSYLTLDEDDLLSDLSSGDLEMLLSFLVGKVHEIEVRVSTEKDEIMRLETERAQYVTERDNCLSLAAQIVHLHPVLEEEFKTREQLQVVAAELKRLKKDIAQDTSEQPDAAKLEQLIAESETMITSLHQKQRMFKSEKIHLTKVLETTQNTLSEAQAESHAGLPQMDSWRLLLIRSCFACRRNVLSKLM